MIGYSAASFQGGSAVGGIAPLAQVVPSDSLPPPPPPPAGDVPPVDPKIDHIQGDGNADLFVIEYSDFECPFCQRHHPTMQQLVKDYDGKVAWVYRHFPLGFHQNAEPAAIASECANELGGNDAFWQFADLVFEKGFDFAAHAKEIGLNEAKFKSCIDSGKFKQFVQDQMNGGSQAGVDGTPGNIVYNPKTKKGEIVSGAQPVQNFKTVIDRMLKE
ncbi:hypothetical protein A3H22_04370 [Candidatus Peribacteria bacterium RIFCSPLOWO2_12_FULL_55_15]|nr:MAG: hypothetical protein A3H22_04370 [Candidatus Peribacteria bacterium RIFCSPLOWO2_12_FULL_55_15]